MRYAIINEQRVENIVVAEQSYFERLVEIFPDSTIQECTITSDYFVEISIGDYFINNRFQRYMRVAKLTIQQKRELFGQQVDGQRYFNVFIASDGTPCIEEKDVIDCTNTNVSWVNDLVISDFAIDLPSVTPPAMTGYGILIPTEAVSLNLFPNNQFNLNGFVINLTSTSQGLAVDLGYLGWQEFRDEQDKEINSTIKDSFSALWYELLTRYQNNEIIPL